MNSLSVPCVQICRRDLQKPGAFVKAKLSVECHVPIVRVCLSLPLAFVHFEHGPFRRAGMASVPKVAWLQVPRGNPGEQLEVVPRSNQRIGFSWSALFKSWT